MIRDLNDGPLRRRSKMFQKGWSDLCDDLVASVKRHKEQGQACPVCVGASPTSYGVLYGEYNQWQGPVVGGDDFIENILRAYFYLLDSFWKDAIKDGNRHFDPTDRRNADSPKKAAFIAIIAAIFLGREKYYYSLPDAEKGEDYQIPVAVMLAVRMGIIFGQFNDVPHSLTSSMLRRLYEQLLPLSELQRVIAMRSADTTSLEDGHVFLLDFYNQYSSKAPTGYGLDTREASLMRFEIRHRRFLGSIISTFEMLAAMPVVSIEDVGDSNYVKQSISMRVLGKTLRSAHLLQSNAENPAPAEEPSA